MNSVSPVLPHSPQLTERVFAENQPAYFPLPVVCFNYNDGTPAKIARWRLTWRERLRVLWTGTLWTEILATTLPPQLVHTREPLTYTQEEQE